MRNLIEERDVTGANLSVELERSVIQHNMEDDGDLYVTEDDFYPLWVKIIPNRGYIAISTNTRFSVNVNYSDRLKICNEINSKSYFLSAYTLLDDRKLRVDHFISYRDGLMVDMFIRVLRKFSSSFQFYLNEIDKDNKIILMPGQIEE